MGFGMDSLVEVISGIGILHMVLRMKRSRIHERDRFEKTALKITGIAFFLLGEGLVLGSVISILKKHEPEPTLWELLCHWFRS